MFKGYNLKYNPSEAEIALYKEKGLELYENDRIEIENTISQFKTSKNTIDGSKLQASWFPIVNADVFISHSHKDKNDIALTFAGWLSEKFGLKAFIDSCIWGYADDLLKLVDNTYCKSVTNPNSYDYKKRNYSTSHIHMMLSTALTMMIDETECLFFLNTPNSITPNDEIEKTLSPWIYTEIVISKLIRQKELGEYRGVKKFSRLNENKQLLVEYDVDLSHLTAINRVSLLNWSRNMRIKHPQLALKKLYELYP